MQRRFVQVDVFGASAYRGNPLAVVLDAAGLSDDEMQGFASWTNLSETTFVLAPTTPAADYRVRIFTGSEELPFAGHPTLGTAHAWLTDGGTAPLAGQVVQECAAGLITIRSDGDGDGPGAPEAFEVRGFFPSDGHIREDPVTGSLNASIGQWLIAAGLADRSYVARQGTVLGRAGRVHISADDEGAVWVGGRVVTCISGHVDL